jgi:predicted PurR-regulated permease PerM
VDRRSQRVEIVIPVRTMLVLLAFGGLVALAVLSIGTLLSIFVAIVLALGLDPVVAALVRRGLEARPRGAGGGRRSHTTDDGRGRRA